MNIYYLERFTTGIVQINDHLKMFTFNKTRYANDSRVKTGRGVPIADCRMGTAYWPIVFRQADLPQGVLRQADLPQGVLRQADLPQCVLRQADLPQCVLRQADLPQCVLRQDVCPKYHCAKRYCTVQLYNVIKGSINTRI